MPTYRPAVAVSGHQANEANGLARVSLTLVLVPVAGALLVLLTYRVHVLAPSLTLVPLFVLGGILMIIAPFTTLATLITGHVALLLAKHYAPAQARRPTAIIALIVAYLFVLGYGVLFFLMMHQR